MEGELDGSGEGAETAAGAEEGVAVGACAGDAGSEKEKGGRSFLESRHGPRIPLPAWLCHLK